MTTRRLCLNQEYITWKQSNWAEKSHKNLLMEFLWMKMNGT